MRPPARPAAATSSSTTPPPRSARASAASSTSPPTLAGQPLHLGFYADDAVSLVIFDKAQTLLPGGHPPAAARRPHLAHHQHRHLQPAGALPARDPVRRDRRARGARDVAASTGTFTDFELPANQVRAATSLQDRRLHPLRARPLLPDGERPRRPSPTRHAAQQCNRQFANLPGNGGCGPGYYCNEAALCAPCDSALFCGPTCSPCGGRHPVLRQPERQLTCVECRVDTDCRGDLQAATPTPHLPRVQRRRRLRRAARSATPTRACPAPRATTAPASRATAAPAAPAAVMKCAPLTAGGAPDVRRVLADADCAAGKLLRPDQRPLRRGAARVQHRRPLRPRLRALPGRAAAAASTARCASSAAADLDCGDGSFCLSGGCAPCATDRHCGRALRDLRGRHPLLPGRRDRRARGLRALPRRRRLHRRPLRPRHPRPAAATCAQSLRRGHCAATAPAASSATPTPTAPAAASCDVATGTLRARLRRQRRLPRHRPLHAGSTSPASRGRMRDRTSSPAAAASATARPTSAAPRAGGDGSARWSDRCWRPGCCLGRDARRRERLTPGEPRRRRASRWRSRSRSAFSRWWRRSCWRRRPTARAERGALRRADLPAVRGCRRTW